MSYALTSGIDGDDRGIAEVTDRVDLPYIGPVCVMFPVSVYRRDSCHVCW